MKEYPPEAWLRLGKAAAQARRAIGHGSAESFADETDVGLRSIQKLEGGHRVGIAVLEAIGRALGQRLRDWDVNTPVSTLEGGPIPSLELGDFSEAVQARKDIAWHDALREFTVLFRSNVGADKLHQKTERWRERFRKVGFTDSDLFKVMQQAQKAARAGG